MRLIDADALKEYFEKCLKVESGKDNTKERYAYMAWLRSVHAIDNAPTVDAVEVVRCKDCKHRIHDEERCLYYCEMYYGQGDVSDDNFCQWGAKE